MKGLIELFKEFHSLAVEGKYPASARALYNFFLGELNARYWATDELSYSERELADLAGLSKTTLHENIKFLSDRGHIKTYRVKNRKTVFKILGDHKPTTRRPQGDHKPTSFERSNYADAKDLKDVKDVEDVNKKNKGADAKNSDELEEKVRHAWIQANGENPHGGDYDDLLFRQNQYGAKVVAEVITECRRKRTFGDRVSIQYLDSALRILKGGKSNGRDEHKPRQEEWELRQPDWVK